MEHELILDDYTTRDDGRRSAVGHHHDSGREDHSASRPSQPRTPRRDAAQRYWASQRQHLETPAAIARIKEIRAGAPLTTADNDIILAAIRRAGLHGITDYELARWFQHLDLPGIAWHHGRTIPPDQLAPVLAALLADGTAFALSSTETPYDAAPPRRPITCHRYYASDYPEFCATDATDN